MLFIFDHHQGLYQKILSSLGGTRFLFKVLQSFWNLIGAHHQCCQDTCLFSKRLKYFSKPHMVVNLRKIRRKFSNHKTDYSVCKYGSPVQFMGPIWRLGDRLCTALQYTYTLGPKLSPYICSYLIGIFYMLVCYPQCTLIRSANRFLSLFFSCYKSFRPSYNNGTWIFPVNTHTCSDIRCHKYFLSTVLDSFIDSCAGAKFKTLEMPKWHGAEFYQHCNTIILFMCPSVSLCLFQNQPMARLSLTVRRFTSVFLLTLCLSLLSYGHDVVLPR